MVLVVLVALLLVGLFLGPLGLHAYGYGPSSVLGLVFIVLFVLLLAGRIRL